MSQKRDSINEVLKNLNTVVDMDKIFPIETSSTVSIADLKTIGIQLNSK